MKTAFSTLLCMDMEAEQIAELCQRHGIDGIEIRMDNTGAVLGAKTPAAIRALGRMLTQRGIQLPMLGSSVCLKANTPEQVQKGYDAIEKAAQLGAGGVRVFLGNFAVRTDAPKEALDEAGICEALRTLCIYGAERGIWVCVETHNEFATGKRLAELKHAVKHPNLKFIWDIIHPIEDGEAIEETWEAIGADIVHVHLKDGVSRRDPLWHDYRYTELGAGSLPIPAVLRLLERAGYQGFVSLEWEAAWREELRELRLSQDALLAAFRDCLQEKGENLLPPFEDAAWSADAPMQDDAVYALSPCGGRMLAVGADAVSPLHRYLCTQMGLESGGWYEFSVYVAAVGLQNPQMVYAILSVLDADGVILRREYAEQLGDGRLKKQFALPEVGRGVRIELGLKGVGTVRWYTPHLRRIRPPAPRKAKIAVTYMSTEQGGSIERNLGRMEAIIDKAAQASPDLILFAETVSDRGTAASAETVFEPEDGACCRMMRRKAKQYGCYLAFTFHELLDGRRYNTAMLIDRAGNTVGKYHKTHLTISEYERGMWAGDSLPVFETDFGRVGFLICYDGYFPEPARMLAIGGAELILVSTAGDAGHRMIARAKENGVYVAVACVNHETFEPDLLPSKIISPTGEILAKTMEEGGYAVSELDLAERAYSFWLSVGPSDSEPKNVYAHERRTDLYASLQREMQG